MADDPFHYLPPSKAASKAGVTERTIRDWCDRVPGLAVRVIGRWRVNPEALDRVLRGELRPEIDGGEREHQRAA